MSQAQSAEHAYRCFTMSGTPLRGKHAASRHVLVRESPSLFIRCAIPSACQVDGEYLGPLPVRFTVTDVLLRVVVPKEFPFPQG